MCAPRIWALHQDLVSLLSPAGCQLKPGPQETKLLRPQLMSLPCQSLPRGATAAPEDTALLCSTQPWHQLCLGCSWCCWGPPRTTHPALCQPTRGSGHIQPTSIPAARQQHENAALPPKAIPRQIWLIPPRQAQLLNLLENTHFHSCTFLPSCLKPHHTKEHGAGQHGASTHKK